MTVSLVWLRRDLRLHDHTALAAALERASPVQPLFVFDTDILSAFPDPQDRRLSLLARVVCDLHAELTKRGGGLLVLHGSAKQIIPRLAKALEGDVFAAEDFEPETKARDDAVAKALGARLHLVLDHLFLHPGAVTKDDGTPYRVFTPFSKRWRDVLTPDDLADRTVEDKGRYTDFAKMRKAARDAGLTVLEADSPEALLESMGYQLVDHPEWPHDDGPARARAFAEESVSRYADRRDRPDIHGTSRLSPYLRFGLVSPREVARAVWDKPGAAKYVSELIWRDFYGMILHHFPDSATLEFDSLYRGTLPWSDNAEHLAAWREGRTGFPIVDAGMRELAATGWMHNRVRMIVACFLTKHLLIDWRVGEAHFGRYLMDYDLASNVGGWQWAASTGTDAAPYFRVFNPTLQGLKFDPEGTYVRRWVPELADVPTEHIHAPFEAPPLLRPRGYPKPIVDHATVRDRAVAVFKEAREKAA